MEKTAFELGFALGVKIAIDVGRIDTASRAKLQTRLNDKAKAHGDRAAAAVWGTEESRRARDAGIRTHAVARRLETAKSAPNRSKVPGSRDAALANAKTVVKPRSDQPGTVVGRRSVTDPGPTRTLVSARHVEHRKDFGLPESAKALREGSHGLGDKARAAAKANVGGVGKDFADAASRGKRMVQGHGILQALKHPDPAVRQRAQSVAKKFMQLRNA